MLQIEEEQFLLAELKKIEARKKERERKTQDLQKLISQADNQTETPRKTDKKLPKKKLANPSRPSRIDTSVSFYSDISLIVVNQRHLCFVLNFVKRQQHALLLHII